MKTLTVFTPTYNRKHTLTRTFESLCCQTSMDFNWLIIDDGSTDGTKEWVESLGEKITSEGVCFDWMGRPLLDSDRNHFFVLANNTLGDHCFRIEYVYKPNGGLYSGYNAAYSIIQTELCVCIDSDDYMPEDAVDKILRLWREKGSDYYCGIEGLDFDIRTKQPIGGYFPKNLESVYLNDLRLNKIHTGDTKQVMKTMLMKQVAPMEGFFGEKNFNPIYMLIQVCDKYPLLVLNDNICIVEYQVGSDSMSQGIFKQYLNSPNSFAKLRLLEMTLQRNTLKDKFRSAIHYVSSCLIARDKQWFRRSTNKVLTFFACPFGFMLYFYIKYKANQKS